MANALWWISEAVKAAGDMKLEVIGLPFGVDSQGQWFDETTNVDLEAGEEKPVYYFHGFAERAAAKVRRLGRAVYRGVGELNGVRGHVFDVTLDLAHEMAQAVYEAAKAGIARVSSDSTVHLVRPFGIVGKPGVVTNWPIFGLSLMDAKTAELAANPRAIALAAAKAFLTDPDVETDAAKAGATFSRSNRDRITQIKALLDEMVAQFPPEAEPDPMDSAEPMTEAAETGRTVDILDMPKDQITAMIDKAVADLAAKAMDDDQRKAMFARMADEGTGQSAGGRTRIANMPMVTKLIREIKFARDMSKQRKGKEKAMFTRNVKHYMGRLRDAVAMYERDGSPGAQGALQKAEAAAKTVDPQTIEDLIAWLHELEAELKNEEQDEEATPSGESQAEAAGAIDDVMQNEAALAARIDALVRARLGGN